MSDLYQPDPAVLALLDKLGYGEERMLRVADLEVPKQFQRDLKHRKWNGGFIKSLFGRPVVFIIDGCRYVVDGMHRIELAKQYSEEEVPGIVFEGEYATLEVASALFWHDNSGRVALRAADEFRSACVSGDRNARNLDEELRSRDLDGWCRNRSGKDLRAIGSVIVLASQRGVEHTLYTLDVINDCWPFDAVDGSPHVRAVRGFGQFLLPEKRVKGRKQPRRWNPEDRAVLTDYIAQRYPGQDGLNDVLKLAEHEARGGGGGGGSLGFELVLERMLRRAKRSIRAAA